MRIKLIAKDSFQEFLNETRPEKFSGITEVTGSSRRKIMGILPVIIFSATLGCGSDTTETGSGGSGGAEQNPFSCEAAGSDRPQLITEWDIYNMLNLNSYVPVIDQDSDPDSVRLDYTGASPNDQSSFYRCSYVQDKQCDLTVDAAPNTKYEAAQLQSDMQTIRWYTWPENGETGPRTSDKPLKNGDVVFVDVVSDPVAALSYPAVIKLNQDCF